MTEEINKSINISKVKDWYSSRSNLENKAASVGFDDEERRIIRWEVLLAAQQVDLRNKKILDVGCGNADLYRHLKVEHSFEGQYTGVEFLDAYIEKARASYPEIDFFQVDISKQSLPNKLQDLIVANGLFTIKYPGIDQVLNKFMQEAFSLLGSNGVLAFNLFPKYVNYEDPEFAYFQPEIVYAQAKEITPYVTLRSDYLEFDFTIYMFKK